MDNNTRVDTSYHPPMTPNSYRSAGEGGGNGNGRQTSLNKTLQTEYIDVGDDRQTTYAWLTKTITSFVGSFVSPKTLLGVMRILKAVTLCFLVLNIAADLMYITFLHILATRDVRHLVGGKRDMIIRLYGLALAAIALCMEMDVHAVVKRFIGLKGFMPRGALLFLISAITGSHPIQDNHITSQNDDVINDDEFANVDAEIPHSAVAFQMITSFILGVCAVTYFVSGVLCLDRLTSRAFVSTDDPIARTAIPLPSGVQTPSHELSL